MKKEAYQRFRIRLISLTVLAALIPLLVLAAVLYFRFTQIHSRQLLVQFRHQAEARAQVVDAFLQQRIAQLSVIADTHSLKALTRQGALTEILAALNRRQEAFLDLAVIDTNGRRLISAGSPGPWRQPVDPPWLSAALADGTAVGDVTAGDGKPPHVVMAVSPSGRASAWILAGSVAADSLGEVVGGTHTEKVGDAFLVNRAGNYQTPPLSAGAAPGPLAIDTTRFSGQRPVITHQDAAGGKIQMTGSWLTHADWLLVVTRPAGEGMQPLLTMRNLTIAIIACALILIGLVAFVHTTVTVRILQDAAIRLEEREAALLETYKLAALGKISADILHEVNNPVAVISEKAGWMKDLLPDAQFQPGDSRSEFEDSIASIEQQIKRIQQIVRNILGFVRRMEDHLDQVNVINVLNQTADLLQDQARNHRIFIQRDLDPSLPVIAGDPSQLQQVFANLLHNAVDAIGENGNIYLTSNRTADFIEIEIRDDGPGIPHDQLGRIFDAFYTTKPSGKGTGLGLSICHTIVKQMGGTILVDSAEGKGTTFTVRLPATSPEK